MRNKALGIMGIIAVLTFVIAQFGLIGAAQISYAQPSYAGISPINNRIAGASPDLNGIYTGKPFGVYYITQVGNNIYWYGEDKSQNPSWSNIAYGTINGNTITLNWADVPKGNTHGSGTLTLGLTQPSGMIVLTVNQQTGGFGTTQIIKLNNNAGVLPGA